MGTDVGQQLRAGLGKRFIHHDQHPGRAGIPAFRQQIAKQRIRLREHMVREKDPMPPTYFESMFDATHDERMAQSDVLFDCFGEVESGGGKAALE